MNLIRLSELLLDEKKAEQYLLEVGILKTFTSCEKCESEKIGRIRRGRYKCYGCKAEWGFRKNSVLHGQSISTSKFLGLIKMFDIEQPASEASTEIEMNLKTTKNIYYNIRLAISGIETNALQLLKKSLKKKSPKFSLSVKDSKIKIGLLEKIEPGIDLLSLERTRVPNKETSYTFQFSKMDARTIDRKLNSFPIQINYFWRYARKRLLSYRGTKLNYLYLYLKEIEFRYNNRDEIIFDKIVEKMSKFNGWQIGVAHDEAKKIL